MNAPVPIPFPRWHKVAGALFWELVWKNKVVFPALAFFLVLGAGLALAVNNAAPEVWWANHARGTGFVAFLASILLGFAPFTLMDNHGGWRMNSVTSRWSILPVGTLCLVAVPLIASWVLIGLLVGAWIPVLTSLCPGIDMLYVLAVFLTGVVALQALAWALPRRPSQYWVLAAVLFLLLLFAAVVPQDRMGWPEARLRAFADLGIAVVGCGILAVWAARRNRCGDWPGELPTTTVWDRLHRPIANGHPFRRPMAAMFWSEVAPVCRTFVLSWITLSLLVAGLAGLNLWLNRPGVRINWTLLGFGMLAEGLPNIGVIWLMGWGLFLGTEPGLGFQTRLSGFRATRPITAGTLAGMRAGSLALAWLCVWMPLLILQRWFLHEDSGALREMAGDLSRQASDIMAGRMVFSASAIVAALPVLLWGRLEGFPTVFLATLIAWSGTWILSSFSRQDPPPAWLGLALAGLLAVKLAVAIFALLRTYQQGYTTWRYSSALFGTWLCTVGLIYGLFPAWQNWGLLALALMIPLDRLAICPLAMAANRHA